MFSAGILFGQGKHMDLKNGYAVSGYDVVAYFQGKAVKGIKEKFSYKHDGVYFAFSNVENLNTFKADPLKYIPQYGGHCSYAMATRNKKVSADPEVFEIRDGKLHLFYREKGLKNWLKEGPEKLRAKADANWAKMIQ